MRASIAARVAASASAVRRSIQLAQAAYPQRMRRIHVVGAPSLVASSLNLMRSCVNEKIRKRVQILYWFFCSFALYPIYGKVG